MNKLIIFILTLTAALSCSLSVSADEGDYIVILKEAPAVMLFNENNGVINSVDNVFVTDSLMSAYALAPMDNIEAIFPDEKAYLMDETAQLDASSPTVYPYPDGADDPYYSDQWHLPFIKATSAWKKGFTGYNVVVGIIDSGLDTAHPDLPDPIYSYNAMSGADTSDITDTLGHGTAVAGLIAAKTNNSIYISGIASGVDLAIIKVANANELYTSALILGFKKAQEYGCDIINMSLGFTEEAAPYSVQNMKPIVKKAINSGTIVVAAAGNEGDNSTTGGYYQYPASFDNVISVGSLGDYSNHTGVDMDFTKETIWLRNSSGDYSYTTILSDVPSSFTQHNDKVICAAPGYRIRTTAINSSSKSTSGTSFSSPIVAGAAAIIKQINPDINAEEFIEAIKETSRDVFTEGYDIYTGYGAIDMEALINYCDPLKSTTAPTESPEPTTTPEPTQTPEPTTTPEPTPEPTATPEPTQEPTPTPEPDGITKNGNLYTVRISYPQLETDARVLAGIYKDGKLTAVKSTAVSSGSEYTKIYFSYNDEFDYIDVFIWKFTENGEIKIMPLQDKTRMYY